MMKFNNFHRCFRSVAVLVAAAATALAACTKVDDTLGSNLVPDNQQMKTGSITLGGRTPYQPGQTSELNPKKYVETRLFRTDSIIGSNISYGYLGSQLNDTIGLRSASFLSQYASYYTVDSGYFGYRPIFDSAMLLLSISSYGGDTSTVQKFSIYEVIDNKYLTEKPIAEGATERDTTFYLNYDPEKAGIIGSDELFSFELGGDNGPATTSVLLTPTDAGRAYIKRLMLQKGSGTNYEEDCSIYSTDSLEQWFQEFKGLYIRPSADATTTGGAVYATSLSASGLAVYGRNRRVDDPSLIKDTIGMVYYFYNSNGTYGDVSVNSIRHDYAQAKAGIIDPAQIAESNANRNLSKNVVVEGMGGVVTELNFTQEFFDELQAIIDANSDKGFTSLAFSQAQMMVYFTDSDYDWQNLTNVSQLIKQMTAAPSRMGLYTDYKKLTAVSDYAYVYENSYGTTLAYDGYINRSRGCYVMNITGYMQQLWNAYQKAKTEAGTKAVDLATLSYNKLYLAPEAYSLFTGQYGVTQGMNIGTNNAPIRFELTYNLIK